jgi:signal transduction histidine kinase
MFRLLRYFAVTSAAVLVAVAILLFVLYRQTAIKEVLNSAEHGNTVLAQSLANAVWLHHADRIGQAYPDNAGGLADRPEPLYLDEAIERLSVGLPILKIKIIDADGVVFYSTNPEDIGVVLDHHPELFIAARQGNTSSEILHRNDPSLLIDGFPDRDVVETYLPLRGPGGEVRGVFGLYADVTERFSGIRQMSAALLVGLLVGFALLYGGLLLVVRRAEQTMRSQYVSLRESRESLVAKNEELTGEIGRRAEIEAELREARDGAEAASRAKSLFLANMSHELRTPLNAVIGFSQVMVDEVLGRVSPPRYREYAQDIRDSGRHLLALVNNVLDLAKIESGNIDIDLAPLDIHDVVQDSVRAVGAEITANCNTLRVRCPRGLGTMVSDEIKVRGVLTNLVGNAAKFTSNGHIEIEARRDGDNGDGTRCVVFRVSDTGVGMDEKRIEEMFGEFTQHDNSITQKFGGTGLGLAICRRICETLGGSITVESALGDGTTVTVRLPDGQQLQEDEYRPGIRDPASSSAA